MHNCHIKNTKREQLSNTVQFQHKHITNPTITHTNKVIHALADCVKVLQGMTSIARNSQAAQDLQQIIEATKAHVKAQPDSFKDVSTPSATPNILPLKTPKRISFQFICRYSLFDYM